MIIVANRSQSEMPGTIKIHGVSKSLYFAEPGGNRIELYVDQSDDWKRDPAAVASYEPLTL